METPNAAEATELTARGEALTVEQLTAFVESDYRRLIGLAGLVCRGEVEPADVVQSALEQAWRHRAALRRSDRLRPWLDRIVVRQALALRRRRFGFLARASWGEGRELDIAAHVTEPQAWSELRLAFDALSREQRAVVVLHLHAGYSVEETAAMTGAGIETTRSRLRLARAKLRANLSEATR